MTLSPSNPNHRLFPTGRTLTSLFSPRLPAAAWYHYLLHGPEPSACSRWYRTRRRLQHLPQNQGPDPLLGRPYAHRIRAHELGHREVSSFFLQEYIRGEKHVVRLSLEASLDTGPGFPLAVSCPSIHTAHFLRRSYLVLRLTHSAATSTSTPSRVAWSTPTTRSKRIDYIREGSLSSFFCETFEGSISINCKTSHPSI